MLARTTSISYEFASAENIGDRKEQQDRVAIATHPTHPDVLVAVVADGMGGHKGGALASQAVIDAVLAMFEAFVPGTGSPHDWLTGMLMAAHEKVIQAGRGHNRDPRSTGVVALVQRNRIDWAHCGDSRLYAFHNGEYARRTDDHSMVDILVKHGEITEEEALLHPDRSKLFTSLGGPDAPQIAFGSIEKVEAGDTILLASDGLWTYFRNRELAALTEYRDLTTACDRLVELTRRRAGGNGDNLSVAMIRSIGGGGRKGLFGGLFNAKSVAPSPLEDSRRFLLAYLRSASGTAAEAASRRIELCADETALRLAITECTPLFASMSSRKKAASFAARALDLLD